MTSTFAEIVLYLSIPLMVGAFLVLRPVVAVMAVALGAEMFLPEGPVLKLPLMPGFDMDTDLGNRFLLVGVYQRVRPHLLTPDRKKMFWTGHMLLGMGDILPVAARPQWLATVRGAQGALPPDLYSHLVGVAVATAPAARPGAVADSTGMVWAPTIDASNSNSPCLMWHCAHSESSGCGRFT